MMDRWENLVDDAFQLYWIRGSVGGGKIDVDFFLCCVDGFRVVILGNDA